MGRKSRKGTHFYSGDFIGMESLYFQEFIQIGFIRKNHGYKGHLRVALDDGLDRFLDINKYIFLETEGCKIPFLIQELKEEKGTVLKLKYINSSEELITYQGAPLFLLKTDMIKVDPEFDQQADGHPYSGFLLKDQNSNYEGLIERVDEYPQQDMAILTDNAGQEILIPLHEDLIVSIDEDEKIILMDLPTGLIQ